MATGVRDERPVQGFSIRGSRRFRSYFTVGDKDVPVLDAASRYVALLGALLKVMYLEQDVIRDAYDQKMTAANSA